LDGIGFRAVVRGVWSGWVAEVSLATLFVELRFEVVI
jgi:hypothetical protein